MHCKVCGTLCNVDRSLCGPAGFAESMARRGHWHDRFVFPHTGKSWHDQALELMLEIEETPSKRVIELMKQGLDDLLRENRCL